MLLEPAAEASYRLTVSLVDLAHFSSELARLLLLQPRAVLRVMDASAVAAQASLLQRGALAAVSGAVSSRVRRGSSPAGSLGTPWC